MKGQKVFRFNKLFYTYIILSVIFIFACATFFVLTKDPARVLLMYSPAENGAVVLADGKAAEVTVPGKGISKVIHNSDASACAVLMSDGSSYSLYTVTKDSVQKTAGNGTSDFVFSFKGKKAVYITADRHLYSGKKLTAESVSSFAVSPDCSAVIFSKKEDNSNKLYLSYKGKISFVSENYVPLAVSLDGKFLYVLSVDNSLCVLNPDGSMKSKLCSAVQTDSFCFSSDLKSIVFSDGEYTYISTEGKSRIRLVPGNAMPVTGSENNRYLLNSAGNSFICDSKEFSEIFYAADDNGIVNLFYVNKDYGRTDVAQGVKKYVVTGKDSLTYLDSMGKIYEFNGTISELVVSGASDFEATSNNRYIYYMTTAHELYSVKRSNVQLISNGAEKIYMNNSDKLFVVMTDKSLYSVSGAKKSDVISSDTVSCLCDGDITYFLTTFRDDTGTFDLYSSDDGKKFTLSVSGVKKQ